MLEQGADPNKGQLLPLGAASMYGNLEIMRVLLAHKDTDVNRAGMECMAPLHFACMEDKPDAVELLLASGADLEKGDENMQTPLFTAVQWGSAGCVKLLLERGANLAAVSGSGWTALHNAAIFGEIDIVKIFLEWKPKNELFTAQNGPRKETPLDLAKFLGRNEVAKCIIGFTKDTYVIFV